MPERIAEIKKAVFGHNIGTFLKGAFPICRAVKRTAFHQYAFAPIESPFHVKSLIFNDSDYQLPSSLSVPPANLADPYNQNTPPGYIQQQPLHPDKKG
jgi:hypothetical protein